MLSLIMKPGQLQRTGIAVLWALAFVTALFAARYFFFSSETLARFEDSAAQMTSRWAGTAPIPALHPFSPPTVAAASTRGRRHRGHAVWFVSVSAGTAPFTAKVAPRHGNGLRDCCRRLRHYRVPTLVSLLHCNGCSRSRSSHSCRSGVCTVIDRVALRDAACREASTAAPLH